MNERLDRIEAVLQEVAQSQVNTQQSIEASRLSIEEMRQLVVSNARATEANSNAIAELRASQQDFMASIEDVVGMVGTIAENMDAMARQAEQDRLEFRSTVRSLLEALTQRFSGNGHG